MWSIWRCFVVPTYKHLHPKTRAELQKEKWVKSTWHLKICWGINLKTQCNKTLCRISRWLICVSKSSFCMCIFVFLQYYIQHSQVLSSKKVDESLLLFNIIYLCLITCIIWIQRVVLVIKRISLILGDPSSSICVYKIMCIVKELNKNIVILLKLYFDSFIE